MFFLGLLLGIGKRSKKASEIGTRQTDMAELTLEQVYLHEYV